MKKTDSAFDQARRSLLLDHVFFGSLVMNLEPQEDQDAKRALWVDGRSVGYNPEALQKLELRQRAGLLAKGVLHCALQHHLRRGRRDKERWQKAADYATNPLILESGLRLPPGALVDPQYAGKSAEEIYTLLQAQEQQSGGGTGQGQGKPQPQTGEVRDLPGEDGNDPSQSERSTQGEEWKIGMQQALQNAMQRGDLPASLKRMVAKELEPRISWREELWKYFRALARDNMTWARPNRRFIASGLYLPAVHSEKMGRIVIAVDTSGSITAGVLAAFQAEINAIIEDVQPELVSVVYCDARVQRMNDYQADDLPVKLTPIGGGGTDFRPVFDWVVETPDVLVYLTDMFGSFPQQDPGYPVLWVSTSRCTEAPFGDVVQLNLSQEG